MGRAAVDRTAASGAVSAGRGQAATAVMLQWHAPLALGCDGSGGPAHDAQEQVGLKLNTVTPPMYYRGCEFDSACWAQVVAFNVPAEAFRFTAPPGARCSTAVTSGQFVVVAVNGRGPGCWSRIVIVP